MANDFKPTVGGKVPKAEAMKWIEKYEKDHRKDKFKDTKSIFFGKDMLKEILRPDECTGITIFFAKKMNQYSGKEDLSLVLVGTKEDGTLLWPSFPGGKDDDGKGAYDNGSICPPICPSTGP
jgi:hypothetical protein